MQPSILHTVTVLSIFDAALLTLLSSHWLTGFHAFVVSEYIIVTVDRLAISTVVKHYSTVDLLDLHCVHKKWTPKYL